MRHISFACLLSASCTAALVAAPVVHAQTSLRDNLPAPDPGFKGRIGETPGQSLPDWPGTLEAPAAAPNILLIMTDDVGFATASTFGGPVPTPHLDRLAARGLIYNRFHTTALCSPSRAALLTGRNAHRVATGNLVDSATGFPGYNGVIPQSAASIARILQLNGYSTAMFGKHHNVPAAEQSAAGPFTQWPTGLGFDYFYGFIGGDVHQWTPRLYRGTSPVDDSARQGGLLDQRLANDAIDWIHNQKAAAPDKPFMIYLAPGSLHAPHQAPRDWIARFRGQFDKGWDVVRAQSFARQRALGVIPADTRLTPRPAEIPAWNSLDTDRQRYSARMMEVAAAMLAFQDEQIGRVIDELERMGQLDDTLIVFVEGDNGASGEGTPIGTSNELGELVNGVRDTPAELNRTIDAMGGPRSYQNYPIGWAWALSSPFRWTKQFASYLGGTRNAMVVSWPKGIAAHGEIRSQFSHLVDIAPTLLDAAGVPAPAKVYGVDQTPMDGQSLVPSFRGAPERPRTQYFEISGAQAIYHDGWLAGLASGRMPWEFKATSDEKPKWELYDLDKDFSQSRDLAAERPEKLAEMRKLFDQEAVRNQVYPIDPLFAFARVAASKRPPAERRTHFTYWGAQTSVMAASAPLLGSTAFELSARIDVADEADGVILASGSRFGGWSFFLDKGRPVAVHAYTNMPGNEVRIAASAPLKLGKQMIRFRYTPDGAGMRSGKLEILKDDMILATGAIAKTIVVTAGIGETLDIGRDTGVAVTDYGWADTRFRGAIERVDIDLGSRR